MAYTTIDDPSAHFQTMLWTGDDADDRALTNDGNSDLKPDLVWIKERNSTSAHQLIDSTRGGGLALSSHDDLAEESFAYIDTFDTDGFTLETSDGSTNQDGNTFVAWQWKANGGTTSSVSASGTTLASTHQTDSTSKFCIMTWTGSGTAGHKVTHGLGSVPKLIIVKKRSGTDSWAVYQHKNTSAPETDYLHLDETIATADSVDRWNDTAPTSTLITLGDAGVGNADSGTYVGYCWDEVQGYSKFGSYTGNGNADGPFIYTGFKPAWIIQKNAADSTNWNIHDNKRSTSNTVDDILMANATDAEGAVGGKSIDFLSNGFKLRGNDNETNDNGDVHIYMAFAEQPFVTSGGVPCTAR
tara:strand:- start:161 stop:1228 length:1068 start_codon:yes stop_codon:yes gene_type:complete